MLVLRLPVSPGQTQDSGDFGRTIRSTSQRLVTTTVIPKGLEMIQWIRRFLIRWGMSGLVMAAIFIASAIPSDAMPRFGEFDFSVKKAGHMLGYALLAAAYWRGLGVTRPRGVLLAWLMAVAYAGSDEFHQSFSPGRSATFFDMGFDSLGALIGLWAANWFQFNHKNRPS